MTSSARLDAISPQLAESFRRATPEGRLRATLVACEMAIAATGLTEPLARDSLEHLRQGEPRTVVLKELLEARAAQLDEAYFQLGEKEGDDRRTEALHIFGKARATSALAFALSGDEQRHEAVYEAAAALADPTAMLSAMEKALRD
jgi:hypothetical protein